MSTNQWPGVLAGLCCGCLVGYFYATGSSLDITVRPNTGSREMNDDMKYFE